jgi:hypothetical protein
MPKDGLRQVPKHVTAALLRALMTLPRRPETRLILQRAEFGRAPGRDRNTDYNVVFRGRTVGRIHYYDRYDDPAMEGPWHWYWQDLPDRKDAKGSAPTLEVAMADFRRAWDSSGQTGRAG